MATITEQKIINGLLEDEKNLRRVIPQAVSQLDGSKALLLDVCAYFFTNPDGVVDPETVQRATAAFQAEFIKVKAIAEVYAAIEACGNAENGPANLQAMITAYGLDPSTFANRYK